ncbi:HlyD family efflux transporter periplasmic adaptor subunit [Alteromonas sp. C1M14]|uniref:HlyD family secretion protein n=1 Tax=Alteromonas sp. C1M14 TaxID=2841567 RepID=UPI001C08E117|nr:HlyD family efflux transporter periplasmic adaptor subunit [Alteromonas sp. C1M14]MBU2979866.1 HlyD family efflux transporter periplasmic adaptor subunit [Alteromonas sp. C1M14]
MDVVIAPRSNLKKRLFVVILVVVILAFFFLKTDRIDVPKSKILSLQTKPSNSVVVASAVLESASYRSVAASSSGIVKTVEVNSGSTIEAGQIAVEIVNSALIDEYDTALYEYETEQINLEIRKSELREDIIDLEGKIGIAQLELEEAELNHRAYMELIDTGSYSKLTFTKSEFLVKRLTAQLASLANLKKVKSGIYESQIDNFNKKLALKKRALDILKRKVEALKIVSPLTGIVSQANVNIGDSVTNGQFLFDISDPQNLSFSIRIPEFYFNAVDVGNRVRFYNPRTEKSVNLPISSVNKISVNGHFVARAQLASANNVDSLIGSEWTAKIRSNKLINAIEVPRLSWFDGGDFIKLYVLTDDHTATAQLAEFKVIEAKQDTLVLATDTISPLTVVLISPAQMDNKSHLNLNIGG